MRSQTAMSEPAQSAMSLIRMPGVPPGEKARVLRELRQHNPEILESISLKLIEDLTEAHSALHTAKEKLAAIHEKVDGMMAPPHFPARCISVAMSARGVEALVLHNGQPRRVLIDSEEVDPGVVSCGTEVLLNETLNRVVGVTGEDMSWGETAVVDRWIEDRLLVTVRGEQRAVLAAAKLRGSGLNNGDRVALDSHGVMALSVLPASSGEEYMIQGTPSVSFSDIGGLDQVIGRVKELVHLHCHGNGAAQRFGLPRNTSILLAGSTGSGKTMVAQATCRYLSETSGTGASRFMLIGPGDLKSMWYGETEQRIRNMFRTARSAAERDLSPLVIYFEEVDAFLATRGGARTNRIDTNVTAALLAEMDGFHKLENVWIIASTNRLQDLDPAAVRASRLGDNIIVFGGLSRAGAKQIFGTYIDDRLPFENTCSAGIIDAAVARLFAPNGDNRIAELQYRDGTKRAITARDLLSGAEISKIARFAKERAALRQIEHGGQGMRAEDIDAGIEKFLDESSKKLRPHNVRDYVAGLHDDLDVVKVEPVRRRGPMAALLTA
jgi:proteasome-associated ATPase